jgi:hypothetical protein
LCAQAELSRTAMERDVPRFDNWTNFPRGHTKVCSLFSDPTITF